MSATQRPDAEPPVAQRAERAEVERLRAGLEALATAGARGIDLTPTTCGTFTPQWVYDYLATLDGAWRDHVRALLNPTEGDRDE